MKIQLLQATDKPLETVYMACKTCTSTSKDIQKLLDEWYYLEVHAMDENWRVSDIVNKAVQSGHESVLEHCSMTVHIHGISRACSHQLVRHRLASYSQQSQRYVELGQDMFVQPQDRKIRYAQHWINYENLIQEGCPREDARFVLPEGTATDVMVTMNARELLHFFSLRCCTRAQWEIRNVANEWLKLARDWFPEVFNKAGAKCQLLGYCTEQKSCGKAPKLQNILKFWHEHHQNKDS